MSRSTLRTWTRNPGQALAPSSRCWIHDPEAPVPRAAYAYLLGQYLGDGHLALAGRAARLRIICADAYPGIRREVVAAIAAVSGKSAGAVRRAGCHDVNAYWTHWPCLFPQAGPGPKHLRPIKLAPWQQAIVEAHPQELVRGLIHSDGSRSTNTVVVRGGRYVYPRYLFSNESADILAILTDALDRLGVPWRANRRNSISVARREGVAALDAFIGPKE